MPDVREKELLQQIAREKAEVQRLRQENELLRQKVDALARQLFGKGSEQLDPAQLQMLFQELETPGPALGKESGPQSPEAESARPTKASPGRDRRPRLPEHLPVLEEVIVPPPVQAAPEQWRQIGEEVTERLDYEPGRFLRRRTVRPKYVRRGELDAVPIIAPLPEALLERSLVAPGLLAQIVVAKYCDHLPLYRQEAIYWSRHQVWLPRQTMAEWVGLAAEWLQPIYQQIGDEVFGDGYIQVDETPLRYLSPGHGKTKLGYLWVCGAPGRDAIFRWETSRAATCLENLIPVNFAGTIQCDGYEVYDCFARRRGDAITLAGCLAHVRRKFFEAREQAPKVAGWFLKHFQNLYALEARLRDTRAGPRRRQAERASLSRPVLARLHRALVRLKSARRFLPRSLMGKAIDYALGQWASMQPFLEDGRVEIDNNLVENAIRPTAVGKKNWLFIGDAAAGERSAIIYTVVESCRRQGLDPYAYLRELFTALPTMTNRQIKDWTPAAWAKSRHPVRQAA